MLRLEKRKIKTQKGTSLRWYITGTCPYSGEPVRQSTKTGDRGAASDHLAIWLERGRKEALHGPGAVATFAEAVVHYLGPAVGGSERFLDPLLDALGTTTLASITDKDIAEFCTEHYPTAKASTLVRQVYGPLQSVWNAAADAEPPLAIPRKINKPTVSRPPVKYAKNDQHLEAILKAVRRPERRAGILFSSFSGARASEVCRVLSADYDPAAGVILLGRTKNGEARRVPLPAFVNDVIAALPGETDDEGKPLPLFGFPSRYELYKTLKRAAKAAKVEFLSPHKIGRHTFAARYLRDGNSLAALKQAGGWNSIGAVSVYAHLEQDHVDDTIRNVKTPLSLGSTDGKEKGFPTIHVDGGVARSSVFGSRAPIAAPERQCLPDDVRSIPQNRSRR